MLDSSDRLFGTDIYIIQLMQKLISIIIIGAIGYFAVNESDLLKEVPRSGSNADTVLQNAYDKRLNDLQVAGSGEVVHVLPDDNNGSRHQRFILKTSTGQTLLVAHNIDLAPRVPSLNKGDRIEFNGEYEWSSKGGVIHWTHHDPQRRHIPGWLKHKGKTYQ